MDTSDILEGQQVIHYLTTVGQLQWLITLGRFDIQAQVISMSRFRAQQDKDSLRDNNEFMHMSSGQKTMQTGLGQTNQIIHTYLISILIWLIQFIVMFRR